ncbi:GAF domain-containing protein [Frigoriglobus tundricola]|uniref:Free methionine-(R)-sulfoxide reductase, contains GAF domain n=1 Tax=Frigoriglobus tundricola TaxID=2774151 RepID=A0A6M5YVR9_9BACT|nr:GAF domain-containing protein [Frigoriglobus tundricola]QJW97323.1 Free methionine-(R)-sulfoxide reductase, contains GAF domain [Frigoriglobus tundricola]
MHALPRGNGTDKTAFYTELNAGLAAVLEGERDLIANAANCAAVLFHALPDVNWAGFYFLRGPDLVLGPFQGKPACVRIALGRGVCGTAAAARRTVIVPGVHQFAGHIACDSASNSEIVVPLLTGDRLIGVLDVDSASFSRFDESDAEGLRAVAAAVLAGSDVAYPL